MLLRDKQTNKQTNQCCQKHNLLGGAKNKQNRLSAMTMKAKATHKIVCRPTTQTSVPVLESITALVYIESWTQVRQH